MSANTMPAAMVSRPIERRQRLTPIVRLSIVFALTLIAAIAFMTLESRGNWDFVLPFRGRKLAALALVAYAISVSTVLFQTMTANRILTPSIMGFDAIYLLIQTVIVFFFGSGRLLTLDPQLRFMVEAGLMIVFAGTLYFWLFVNSGRSLHLLLLVGIIFGALFRSLTNFLQRLIEPNEFVILSDAGFASFGAIDPTLLGVAALITLLATGVLFVFRDRFDVLILGRDHATALGLEYRTTITIMLSVVIVMVAVSTALVGPVTFFGLIVANVAYLVAGTNSHKYVLPMAVLLGILALVGGQTVLERVFSFNTTLSIIIECVGGLLFIGLVLKGKAR